MNGDALFSCGAGLELAMRRVVRRRALPLVLALVLHSLAALQEVSSDTDATGGSAAAAGVHEARDFASPSVPTRLGGALSPFSPLSLRLTCSRIRTRTPTNDD